MTETQVIRLPDAAGSTAHDTKDPVPEPVKQYNLYEKKADKTPVSYVNNVAPKEESVPTEAKAETIAETPAVEEKPSRRDAFKRASEMERAAREKDKVATQKLAEAQKFQSLFEQAKTNPTIIAQALGMHPTDFLNQYSKAMFALPEEQKVKAPELKPEEVLKQRIDQMEEQQKQERFSAQERQKIADRNHGINTYVAPVISDAEKYQLINANKDECMGYIFDMASQHYNKTGELLDLTDAADALEESLLAKAEEDLARVKKIPKLAQKFKEESVAEVKPQDKNIPKTITAALGTKGTGSVPERIKSKAIEVVYENDGRRVMDAMSPKEARLLKTKQRLAEMYKK